MKNKKATYSDIEYWASVLNESAEEEKQYNEACQKFMENKNNDDDELDEAGEQFKVDDDYIKRATAALAELKKTNPEAYALALKYLNYQKNKNLVVSPEDFAKGRIQRAMNPEPEKPVDTRSAAEQRAELMQRVADKHKADAAAMEPKVKEQRIKSIWIKSMENNQMLLQITFMDGHTEDVTRDMTVIDGDKYYKEVAQSLRASRRIAKNPERVTVKDVELAMVRIAYNDQRITWYYGKSKMPESAWKYAQEVKKQSRSKSTPLSRAFDAWQANQ